MYNYIQKLLTAPFLREVSGQELYQYLQAIHTSELTGQMECAVNKGVGGAVSVLDFDAGRPAQGKSVVAALVHAQEIVMAWMPGKTKRQGVADEVGLEPTMAAIIDQVFTEPEQGWCSVIADQTLVAQTSSNMQLSLSAFVGLLAELNGSFSELLGSEGNTSIDIGTNSYRIGFEYLGGPYRLLYKVRRADQIRIPALVTTLRKVPVVFSAHQSAADVLISAATELTWETEYFEFRPDAYRNLKHSIVEHLAISGVVWEEIWLKYRNPTIFYMHKDGESNQQFSGAMHSLMHTISDEFATLVGEKPDDFVIRGGRYTMWCNLGKNGSFIAAKISTGSEPVDHQALGLLHHICSTELKAVFGPL